MKKSMKMKISKFWFSPVHTVPADPELAEAPRVLGGRGALSIRPPAVSARKVQLNVSCASRPGDSPRCRECQLTVRKEGEGGQGKSGKSANWVKVNLVNLLGKSGKSAKQGQGKSGGKSGKSGKSAKQGQGKSDR